jgi:hypothetical protein
MLMNAITLFYRLLCHRKNRTCFHFTTAVRNARPAFRHFTGSKCQPSLPKPLYFANKRHALKVGLFHQTLTA